ncbi:hypothetical protein KRR55_07675 [Paeniglutamicibacter sp. ABSL32-1]|uniref:hypothetical protein n=1 Tax=Paeniglutamicibacter quisquiliarum TaxID=2849498 RepID=UPI001C2DA765|nr:hypothetical protein [Paeniglutamicibacter quisquiliarum]MBV1778988.1 hypothetical protein [Paeniglutamicibacter quisquiliarum]
MLVNVVLVLLVTGSPGWRALPFLTEDTLQVIGVAVAALIAGAVVNFINLVLDIAWVKAVGDIVTSVFALAVLTRLWRLFPFAFGSSGIDWGMVTRVLIVVAIAGCVLGVLVEIIVLLRTAVASGSQPGHQR